MPERKFTAGSSYRYGFNGKEKDNGTGEGNMDFGARIIDVRVGRFLSLDPLAATRIGESPYGYAGNNPIQNNDIEGAFWLSATTKAFLKKYYPRTYAFITSKNGLEAMATNPKILEAFSKLLRTAEDIKTDFTYGSGPELRIMGSSNQIEGQTPGEKNGRLVKLNTDLLDVLEDAITEEDIEAALMAVFGTIEHEFGHVSSLRASLKNARYPNTEPNNFTNAEDGRFVTNEIFGDDYDGIAAISRGLPGYSERLIGASKVFINKKRAAGEGHLIPKTTSIPKTKRHSKPSRKQVEKIEDIYNNQKKDAEYKKQGPGNNA